MIPKKSLGQNFLIDKNICKKIVSLIEIKNKVIIEIGPGTGQLTKEIILSKPKKIILIEKDINLYDNLKKNYGNYKNIIFYNLDAINFDYSKYNNIYLISNLPYNMSLKIIYKLLSYNENIKDMVLMVQKEVAEKLQYKKNYKMNKHNFVINSVSDYKIIFNISNKVFYPKPKINSSVIKITPKKKLSFELKNLLNFSHNIFSQKRKKISNLLKFKYDIKKNLDENIIGQRAENLNLNQLIKLFNIF